MNVQGMNSTPAAPTQENLGEASETREKREVDYGSEVIQHDNGNTETRRTYENGDSVSVVEGENGGRKVITSTQVHPDEEIELSDHQEVEYHEDEDGNTWRTVTTHPDENDNISYGVYGGSPVHERGEASPGPQSDQE